MHLIPLTQLEREVYAVFLSLPARDERGESRRAPTFSLDLSCDVTIAPKNGFSQVTLIVIRAMKGLWSPGWGSVRAHAHRAALHPALYLRQDFLDRTRAAEQIKHPFLPRVITQRPIDLSRITALGIPRAEFFL